MDFKNKRIAVVGLGKSGFAAAKFLAKKKAFLAVTDGSARPEVLKKARALKKLRVSVETGGHTVSFVDGSELLVTSPGVPKESLPLAFARRKKIPVISEIELASYFCQGPIVAVTGSNGKTTTSHLISKILTDAKKTNVLCGNVGYSFLDFIPRIHPRTVVVLELSSFQLEDSPRFRPKVAVILNIARNHLDRHKTFGRYVRAKEKIFANQRSGDYVVLNYDDPIVRKMAKKARSKVIFFSKKPLAEGVYLKGSQIVASIKSQRSLTIETGRFQLKGAHNMENILACVAVAVLLKVSPEKLQKSLEAFRTLEHRIEPVGNHQGIHFVNDSKSTTVESTKAAIQSVTTPIVLIAGGRDKGANFAGVEALLKNRVKLVVLYGEAREKIAAAWRSYRRCRRVEDFGGAVRAAYASAVAGDTVLLSPMCTSFDQFNSFETRGEAFKQIFRELK